MCRAPRPIRTTGRICRPSASPARSPISRSAPKDEAKDEKPPTSVSLFDQGLIQVLQASVTGLQPKQRYVLALADKNDGSGSVQPLAAFMTNPAGSAIVNAVGPIRQIVQNSAAAERRYLVIAPGEPAKFGDAVQVQTP